jgi:decaprenylphospho-beta-D-erythro-pentofuranosid-2-ulose 2-reductase
MPYALILGANSDIAQCLAYEFARNGYGLLLAARDAARLAPLASDLGIRYKSDVHTLEFDAVDYASHYAFYTRLPKQPDVVIWVAGYLGDSDKARADFHEALNVIEVNYTGAVSLLDHAANDLEKRQTGGIIGISSVAADRGRQSNYHYGSAKAAFSTYLSGLRNRLYASGVHVLTVHPGYVRTRMTAGMKLPAPLTAMPEAVARDVYRAYHKKRNLLYTKWIWRWVMLVIKSIPEPIFKRLKL